MDSKQLAKFKEETQSKVRKYYEDSKNHNSAEFDRLKEVPKKIIELAKEWEIKVHLLHKNMQLESALFVMKDLWVQVATEKGVLADELSQNAQKVLEYDYRDMNLRDIDQDIKNYNAVYGLAATAIIDFDDDEVQPMVDCIDPLTLILDPKNWKGSKMRYIGMEKQVSIGYIRDNEKFNKTAREKAVWTLSEKWRQLNQSIATANRTTDIPDDEMTSICYIFHAHNGMKYLSKWINDFEDLVQVVDIEPLSKSEKLNPLKVKYPIHLHRRKPKMNSSFGVSIWDEVWPQQKALSELRNLQLIGARKDELGADFLLDERLGVNAEVFAKQLPWNRLIDVDMSEISGNPFIEIPLWTKTGSSRDVYEAVRNDANDSTLNYDSLFGQSAPWSQTKSEIQTLQQNANAVKSWQADNYMEGLNELVSDMYRSYVLYMGEKMRKVVSQFDSWKALSFSYWKKDFVTDGKVTIHLVSKSQKAIEDQNDYDRLVVSANMILPNIEKGYALNNFIRFVLEKSGVKDLNPKDYIPETPEESMAINNLELLNNNIDVSEPIAGEDLKTYRTIYTQGIDTKARRNILERIDQMIQDTKAMDAVEAGVQDSASSAMAMNQISQQTPNQSIWS